MAGQQANPFDQFDQPAGGRRVIVTKPADPRLPYEGPLAQSDLANRNLAAQKTQLEIQQLQQKLQAGGGELPPPPGDPTKTGAEYIASLPRGMAPTIKSMIEGRMAPPSSFAQSKPYWQQMMSAANQADPSFDQSQWASRVVTRKAYESQARSSPSQVITSLNTLAGHANLMYENHLNMAGPDLGPFSSMAAGAMQSFDQKYTPAYNTEVGFVQGELQKLVNNGAATQAEAERIINNLRSAQSFEARGSAIKAVVGLAESKIAPIRQGWQAVFGDKPLPSDVTPSSMAVFDNILGDGKQALPVDHYGTPIAPGALGGAGAPPGGGPPTVGPAGGAPPMPPGTRGGPRADTTNQYYDPNGGGPGAMGLSTGKFHTQYNPQVSAQIDGMIRKGYSADRINTALANTGRPPVDPAQVAAAQTYLRQHPDYKGSFANATDSVPTKNSWLNDFQQSRPGVFLDQLSNAATMGNKANIIGLAGGNADLQRAGMDEAARRHPYWATGGNLVGGTAAALAMESGAGALGRAAGLGAEAAPWLARGADAAYGGITGASSNPDDPLSGALKGAAMGLGGGMFGSKIAAPVLGAAARKAINSRFGQTFGNAVRDFRDLPPMAPPPQPLGSADSMLLTAAEKAGIPGIQAQLGEAANLGVPMSLADTHPALTSLAGAAVRRSPNADAIAQGAFIPRSLGQVNRLGAAVDSNLGPVGNIPQISADLIKSAKTNAAPLYDRAYAAGQVNDPVINQLLEHPELKAAFDAAQQHHANDVALALARGEAPPAPLAEAYTIDPSHPNGYRVTTPPDVRTIDYIKRGLESRAQSAFSGNDPQLAMSGGFLKDAKKLLLARTDAAVPDYAAARAAYGGPMQADDALQLGKLSLSPSVKPNQFAMDLAGVTPGDIPHAQLGQRSALMEQAGNAQYSRNPFSLLNTPNMEEKLATMYPGGQGVPNLLRTRDMENGLARTTNDILGNSKTAQRGIADDAFSTDGLLQTGLDLGINAATGQVPIGTMIKGAGRLGLKDAMKFGVGKRAVAKADALAPSLFNTNPAQSSADLTALMNSSQAFRDFVESYNRRIGRPAGMFGAAAGAGLVARQ